ncbi:MAG: hypothetical protein ACRDF0_12090 [Candidatus Limnocylindria bacterium]
MLPSFEGPKAKLTRAVEHLDTLRIEAERFLGSDAYSAVRHIDPKNGDHVWRMKIDQPAPVRLGVLLGDVVHNLRSGLDHLAWQLALIRTPTPRNTTAFPIFFLANTGPAGKGFNPDGRKTLLDLPEDAQKVIESVQPYQRPGSLSLALWLLYKMSITDKHRFILAPLGRLRGASIPISHAAPLGSIVLGMRECDEGGELLRITAGSVCYLHKKEEPSFVFQIGVDIPDITGRHDVVASLDLMHKALRDELFPKFEQFLPK